MWARDDNKDANRDANSRHHNNVNLVEVANNRVRAIVVDDTFVIMVHKQGNGDDNVDVKEVNSDASRDMSRDKSDDFNKGRERTYNNVPVAAWTIMTVH